MDALRAGGDLNDERSELLTQLRTTFKISVDRHKAEVRRAVNNEILNTVAQK